MSSIFCSRIIAIHAVFTEINAKYIFPVPDFTTRHECYVISGCANIFAISCKTRDKNNDDDDDDNNDDNNQDLFSGENISIPCNPPSNKCSFEDMDEGRS